MKRLLVSLCVVLAICFFVPIASAQDAAKKDFESFDLGELYIKGEKLPTAQEATQILEITAADIEATNSTTVAEALAYATGVKVTTGRKNEPNIQIHGIDQSRALILIDGVPYYETNYGKLDLNTLPVDNISKIEIQKGVSSVLYGPNGLVGVINIVTKKPTSKPSIDALLEGTDNQGYRFSLSHGMKVGVFNYWLNYSHQESNGWYMSRDYTPRVGVIRTTPMTGSATNTNRVIEDGGLRENSASKTDAVWAKFGVEPRAGSEYYINFHYIERDKEAPSPVGPTIQNTVFLKHSIFSQFVKIPLYNNWGIDLSGQEKIGDKVTLKGKLFYHDHVDDYVSYNNNYYDGIIAKSRYKDNTLGGSLLADIKLLPTDTLRFSFNLRRDDHKERAEEQVRYAHTVSNTGSLAVENEFNPTKNLSIVAGVSQDWAYVLKAEKNTQNATTGVLTSQYMPRPGYHDALNPMAGITYTFSDETKIFASGARKVRFPTIQQFTGATTFDLTAEHATNFVLGISRPINKIARAEFSFFSHDIDNYITKDAPTIDGKYYNLGRVFLVGFEAMGEIYPTKDMTIKAGYTYIDATNKTHGRVTDRVQYIPEHQFNVGLGYLFSHIGLQTDLNCLYVAQTWGQVPTIQRPTDAFIKTDDYFLVNARISKKVMKNLEVYFAANNILDKNYEPEPDFPAQGRSMYLGMKINY
jgi:iron complex outermembrane recepter protein